MLQQCPDSLQVLALHEKGKQMPLSWVSASAGLHNGKHQSGSLIASTDAVNAA